MIRSLTVFVTIFLLLVGASAQNTIDTLGAGSALTGTELFPMFQSANPAKTTSAAAIATFVTSNAVTSISGGTSGFTLGGGTSVNQQMIGNTNPPWSPFFRRNNTITQTTGTMNVLRNATMTSWDHYKFLTQDLPATNIYKNGIASISSAAIDNGLGASGTLLTVSSSPTGVVQLFQRVTDAVNYTTAAATPVGTAILTLFTTSGINANMRVDDVTVPRAIAGNARVVSTTASTVTLNVPVGFGSNNQVLGVPGVGNGDTLAFSTIARGTEIVGLGTCTTTPTYPCNYVVTPKQLVATEAMNTAGGWGTEGIYMIPVGTAGTSNYVQCIDQFPTSSGGNFAPSIMTCTVSGTLSDLVFRWPIDWVDSSRINCSVYTGNTLNCVSANILLQPLTFQLNATYGAGITATPTLETKISCPLSPNNPAGTNICADSWTNATTDLYVSGLPQCLGTGTPLECNYSYTWTPTGIVGDMEINFHTGIMTNSAFIIIDGFDLKQTPGATCVGTSITSPTLQPPCFQYYPGPLEIPEVTADRNHNRRFAQLIGMGVGTGWNPSNKGPIETTEGHATSSTSFFASWPLPITERCNVWNTTAKSAPTCPVPNIYFPSSVASYTFTTSQANFAATALTAGKIGANSLQIIGTTSGLPTNASGYVSWVDQVILIDSAPIGD